MGAGREANPRQEVANCCLRGLKTLTQKMQKEPALEFHGGKAQEGPWCFVARFAFTISFMFF